MKRWFALFAVFVGCAEGEIPQVDGGLPDVQVSQPDMSQSNEDMGADAFVFGVECDPIAQDCGQGKCVPNLSTGTSTCLQLGEQRDIAQECETITQCIKGAHCALLPNDSTSSCRQMCDPDGVDTCASGTSCLATLSSNPSIGLCAGLPQACDIYANDCATGDCIVSRDPQSDAIGTFCGQAGTRRQGETCGGAAGECEVGNICIQLANASNSTCQPVCRRPDQGPIRACPAGLVCSGVASSSGVSFCE